MNACFLKKSGIIALGAAAILGAAHSAQGDDSGVYAVGGTLRPMELVPGIQLETEYVRALAFPENDSLYVECIFYLRNLGEERELMVGFPENSWGDVGEGKPFTRFQSFVNGEEVAVTRSQTTDSSIHDYQHWWTKVVTFRANEYTVIRNTYSAQPGGTSDGSSWFWYTLWTGGNWDRQIRAADIVVSVVADQSKYELHARPGGYYQADGEFRWHLENFEPSRSDSLAEIVVSWKHRGQ